MYQNWDNVYIWGLLALSFMESPIPAYWYFFRSFNYLSLAFNYESHFGHFDKCGQCSNVTAYSALSCIEKLVSTGSHYFLLVDKLYNLNVFKLQIRYFRHVQKLTRDLYLRPFNAFSFTESSVLTIKYGFSFSGL